MLFQNEEQPFQLENLLTCFNFSSNSLQEFCSQVVGSSEFFFSKLAKIKDIQIRDKTQNVNVRVFEDFSLSGKVLYLLPGLSVCTAMVTGNPHHVMGLFPPKHHKAGSCPSASMIQHTLGSHTAPPHPSLAISCQSLEDPAASTCFCPLVHRVQSDSYDGPLKARKQHHIHSKDSLQAENHELFHLLVHWS